VLVFSFPFYNLFFSCGLVSEATRHQSIIHAQQENLHSHRTSLVISHDSNTLGQNHGGDVNELQAFIAASSHASTLDDAHQQLATSDHGGNANGLSSDWNSVVGKSQHQHHHRSHSMYHKKLAYFRPPPAEAIAEAVSVVDNLKTAIDGNPNVFFA
jgi:hypothetical protein